MPKLKTRKSAAKRLKISGTGKVLRRKAGNSHLLQHESPKEKMSRKGLTVVSDSDMKKVRGMLPYKGK